MMGFTQSNYVVRVQTIGLEEGLSSSNIAWMMQDSKGVIWMATSYGLNRFDGAQIKIYTQEDHGLYHNDLHYIWEDPNGNIWIQAGDLGSIFSFCVFDPITETVSSLEDYLGKLPFDIAQMHPIRMHNGVMMLTVNNLKRQLVEYYEYDGKELRFLFDQPFQSKLFQGLNFGDVFKVAENKYLQLFWKWTAPKGRSHFIYFNAQGKLIGRDSCKNAQEWMLDDLYLKEQFCVSCVGEEQNNQINYSIWQEGKESSKIKILPSWQEKVMVYQDKIYTIQSKLMCRPEIG